MATATYTALQTITLASAAATVTFSNIPANGYRDLVFVIDGKPADTSYPVHALRFNSDSGANYVYVGMRGNGSSYNSGSNASLNYLSLGQAYGTGPSTSSRFASIAQIFDYSQTDKHTTVLVRNNVPDTGVEAQACRWANTAAITSITVMVSSGAGYASGTTMSLYGIAG